MISKIKIDSNNSIACFVFGIEWNREKHRTSCHADKQAAGEEMK